MTWRRLAVEKLPLLALVAVSSVVTFVAQTRGGAVGDATKFPLGIRLENAAVSYVAYLGKTVWPFNLSPFYIHPGLPGEELPIWKPIASALLLITLTGGAVALRRRAPYLLTGWLWYLGTLIPVIGVVQVGLQGMADRYTYFPQIGVLLALCWGAAALVAERSRAWRFAAAAGLGVTAAALAILTWRQADIWHDSVHLWHHAIEATGGNEGEFINYGGAVEDEGHLRDAAAWYRETLKMYPHSVKALTNLGMLMSEEGDQDEALRLLHKSLKIDPDYPLAHTKLGTVLFRKGDVKGALREHKRAVELQPLLFEAWYNRGLAEMTLESPGHLERAVDCYRHALSLKDDFAVAHSLLGNILIQLGHRDEGFAELRKAIDCDPKYDDGHINLGKALASRGDLGGAADQFILAIRLAEELDRSEGMTRHTATLAKGWYNLARPAPARVESTKRSTAC